jgi:peptidoglycan/xylan/chitin deacetylase (PgdA/CDA1 family)
MISATKKYLRSAGIHISANAIYFSGLVNVPKAYMHLTNGQSFREGMIWPFAVLLYHRVNPFRDRYFPAVSVNAFDAQMSYLAKNFNIVSLSQILDRLEQGIGIEPRTAAITFDDGYRDNYLYAQPILKKYGLPASIFVTTGYTATSRRMWNDRIAGAIKRTDRRVMNLELPAEKLSLRLDSDYSRLASMLSVLEKLKSLPEAEKNLLVDDLVEQLGCRDATSDPLMLSWSELREMAGEEWEVGSHTVEHRILTKISEAEIQRELANSKETLEQHLQIPITLFAYPNGKEHDFGESVKELVQAAGYRAALTTVSELNGEGFEPFEIHRISPWEEQLPEFAVKLEWMFWNSIRELSRSLGG